MEETKEISTELINVTKESALAIFTGENGVDKIISQIKAEVAKHTPDLSTVKGRKAIASLSAKVSSAKVKLDEAGKDLVSEWKQKSAKVDAARKIVRDTLDELRDETRKPLTDWEEAEEARAEKERQELKLLADETAAHADHAIFLRLKELEAKEAELNRIEAERLARKEAEQKEAARLETERIQKEEEEQRIKAAEEKARLAAEEAARQKIAEAEAREIAAKVEAERQKQAAADAEAKAEANRIIAEQRAEAEKAMAVKEAEDRAKADAAKAESIRIAAEQQKKFDEEKQAANKTHQRKINNEAVASFVAEGLSEDNAKALIVLIATGKIKNVTVNY